jgi:hypothetical protein
MWSHYTEGHTGIVLGFDAHHPFFNTSESFIDANGWGPKYTIDEAGIGSIREVQYSRERPQLGGSNWDALFIKSADWRYEEELRIFRNILYADDKLMIGGETMHFFRIPPDAFTRVIVGLNASPDFIASVKEYSNDKRFRHIIFERAELNPRRFKLDFFPLI